MAAEVFAPGYYPGLENARYQASKGISKSRLDVARKSLRNYHAKYVAPDDEPEVRTPALIEGEAIHTAILEPDFLGARFIWAPEDAPRRPSERQINAKKPSPDTLDAIAFWADFEAEHAGKTVLTSDQHAMVLRCQKAFFAHPAAALFTGGVEESSFYADDPETGVRIKCRPDYWRPDHGMVLDLKSTAAAGEEPFGRSAETFRYYVQSWWYPHVMRSSPAQIDVQSFVFVAVEKDAPNPIGAYYATRDDLAHGEADARADLAAILQCERTGVWPDHAMKADGSLLIRPLRRPAYAFTKRRYAA